VLKPLSDIAPDLVEPVSRRTLRELWREFPSGREPLERWTLEP
jgi:7,8-dihydro-6-hydroxymethylpterin-pyrophosphokinase